MEYVVIFSYMLYNFHLFFSYIILFTEYFVYCFFQCFFDTPGLLIGHSDYPKTTDVRVRVESAWKTINLYDVLIVIFDAHRHLIT